MSVNNSIGERDSFIRGDFPIKTSRVSQLWIAIRQLFYVFLKVMMDRFKIPSIEKENILTVAASVVVDAANWTNIESREVYSLWTKLPTNTNFTILKLYNRAF